MDDAASQVGEGRTRPITDMDQGVAMELEDLDPRNIENDLVAADGLGEYFNQTPAMLTVRATQMFTEGNGAPRMSNERALDTDPTLWLVKLAKDAVWELFDHRVDEVQVSWGGPLDREEAVAYLTCDALGIQILPGEARNIGRKALKVVKAAKGPDDKLKGKARSQRSRARQAVETDPGRAAGLAARLAEINATSLAARAEIWGARADLPLPDRRAPIVESAAPPPPEPPPPPDDPVDVAAAAVELAEGLLDEARQIEAQAEIAATKAKRALAKLQPPGKELSTRDTLYFFGTEVDKMSEQEQARRRALFSALHAAEAEMRASEWALRSASRGVKDMQRDLEIEQEALRQERAIQRRRAAADAKLARIDAELEAKERAAEVQAIVDAGELQRELQRELAEEKREYAELDRKFAEELARAQWAEDRVSVVEQHAEHVWGGAWRMEERPAPKVFSLVGKSASEVRGMSGLVCQEGTGVEERVALNRIQRAPLTV